ncbi:hypothetical protein L2D08_12665 [Domibacillus sp. PGB-M46]|uniref:hypothetical protein n=1 Tax=Domibacillus sp. PGB-M46 TaxID=2910255 RepID=UPI001F574751|nr:hypothetical protein [Domibacillus sp. PGB-M46]MCI2255219.1 hypothetical protein [Domibacillus sp. PGB-M46]
MEWLRQVDWRTITTYTNSIFIINKDKPEEYVVLLHHNKQGFEDIQVYVDYDQDSETVAYYRIIERVADKKGNLILLAEKEE